MCVEGGRGSKGDGGRGKKGERGREREGGKEGGEKMEWRGKEDQSQVINYISGANKLNTHIMTGRYGDPSQERKWPLH